MKDGVNSIPVPYILSEDDLENEQWKDCFFIDKDIVYDYRGIYKVSNMGRVISSKKKNWNRDNKNLSEKFITVWRRPDGYLNVHLSKNSKRRMIGLHRLVALIFIENPHNKAEVNHKFGIKSDCRAKSLEWATPSENVRHAFKNGFCNPAGRGKCGEEHNDCTAISLKQFDLNGVFISCFKSIRSARKASKSSDREIKASILGITKPYHKFKWELNGN